MGSRAGLEFIKSKIACLQPGIEPKFLGPTTRKTHQTSTMLFCTCKISYGQINEPKIRLLKLRR
jgi:hypothetical protein